MGVIVVIMLVGEPVGFLVDEGEALAVTVLLTDGEYVDTGDALGEAVGDGEAEAEGYTCGVPLGYITGVGMPEGVGVAG